MHLPTHCDVLVIGSGAAGFAAAVTASALGLDVLVCEHADLIGGTTAVSGGEAWIPVSRQAGGTRSDTAAAALRYLESVVGDQLDQARAETYVNRAAEALAFLEDHSHLEYELLDGVVDYYSELPDATQGLRSLGVLPFDGRKLGRNFARIRPPLATSMILGGMSLGREDLPHLTRFLTSIRSAWHVCAMVAQHLRDRLAGQPRGTRMVMGNALVGRLALTLFERSVPVVSGARLTKLDLIDGRVQGATLRHGSREVRIRARHGVIVASGSFSGSARMQSHYFAHVRSGQPHRTHLPSSNDGSGLDAILECGGSLDARVTQAGAWTPVSVVPMPDGTEALAPHFGDRAKPGVIVVDAAGRRFANEALSYHRFVEAMLQHHAGAASAHCHVITSERHLRKYGLGRVPPFPGRIAPFVRNGYLIAGGTLSELARRLGISAASLERTVATFDEHAQHGRDPQFDKGGTAYERAAGDPAVRPNPCVAPLGPGPYYAVRIVPGDIGTMLGARVDHRARVLTAAGDSIPGLYAVGNVAASLMGGTYPAAGAMIGPALTFGYLAVRDIASDRKLRESEAA